MADRGFGMGTMGSIGVGGTDDWAKKREQEISAIAGRLLTSCLGSLAVHVNAQGPRSVSMRIETTGDEIVDVDVGAVEPALGVCLDQAVWALRLPGRFDRDHAFEFALSY